ncbi:MAG TPA: hypothetical protein VGV37_06230 [Aliidongia sp.]|uniref:hypothetical protein n=1 Tax=Aliidongia sp. TaxID=1914230 RepID=UPI002DDD7415|nr:hypothetical protein [Aliidongia sp.]HEV2674122.1 hypothetical protein [Aliidongia sp.]
MTDSPTYPKYFAQVGTKARCIQGHDVALFIEPLMDGETFLIDRHLGSWLIPIESRHHGLCTCGKPFSIGHGVAAQVMVGNDWVPHRGGVL